MKILKLISFLVVVLVSKNLLAQQFITKHFTANDGLASNETYQITTDKQGYIWVGTDRGVSRFDGRDFKTYTVDDGLPNQFANMFFHSPKGKMWVLCNTSQKELAYYDNGKFVPYIYNYKLKKLLNIYSKIVNVTFENETDIIVSTNYEGAIKINYKGEITRLSKKVTEPYLEFEYNRKYPFLCGTNPQINNPSIIFFKGYRFGIQPIRTSSNSFPLRILKAKKKISYLAVDNFLFKDEANSILPIDSFSGIIHCIFQDKQQNLWVATDPRGLFFYKNSDLTKKPIVYFTDLRITSITQDFEGGYWISTHEKGIYYLPSLALQYATIPVLKENEVINKITANEKYDLLFTTNNQNLFQFENGSWNNYGIEIIRAGIERNKNLGIDKPITFFINNNLLQIINDNMYATGLQFNMTNKKAVVIPFISSAIIETDSLILGGFSNGLRIISKDLNKFKHVNSNRIMSLFQDKEKNIWVGNDDGLFKYQNDTIKQFFSKEINSRVSSMAQLSDGTLLFATLTKGLIIVNNNNVRESWKFSKEFPTQNMINKIIVVNDTIFCATQRGIIYFTYENYGFKNLTELSVATGFPFNNINDMAYHDGKLYVLSENRIIQILVHQYQSCKSPPAIYFKKLMINDSTSIDIKDTKKSIEVPSNFDKLRFEYSGISLQQGNTLKYSSSLIKESESIFQNREQISFYDTKEPFVEYNNLKPGKYELTVTVKNITNGMLNKSVCIFIIPPPYWQTWWFILLFTMAIASLVYWRYKFVVNQNNEKNKIRELMLSYEQQALAAQINPHFIFNVITNIQSFVLTQDKKVAYNYLNKFARLMRISLDNSRMKWVSLHSEIELVDIYLELEKLRFARFEFKISCNENIDQQHTFVPSMLIQPFLENSVKHGIFYLKEKEGMIDVHFEKMDDNIVCTIEDNGVGRRIATEKKPIHKEHKSAGQSITNKRMELLMNETKQKFYFEIIDKQQDSGTIVKFNIPYKISYEKLNENE